MINAGFCSETFPQYGYNPSFGLYFLAESNLQFTQAVTQSKPMASRPILRNRSLSSNNKPLAWAVRSRSWSVNWNKRRRVVRRARRTKLRRSIRRIGNVLTRIVIKGIVLRSPSTHTSKRCMRNSPKTPRSTCFDLNIAILSFLLGW